MKLLVKLCVPLVVMAAMSGCEWSSGGDSSWSGAPSWVNFSGVYRGAGGGVLVTDYTATPGTAGTTNAVTGEMVGSTDGNNTVFSGALNNRSILAGSLKINTKQHVINDNGDGTMSGTGATGAVDYGTGAWSIELTTAPPVGDGIFATYQYTIAGTQGSGSAGPGTSGITIFTFTVHQEGNKLEITDNNGSVYRGKFGNVSLTSGAEGGQADEEGQEVFEVGSTAVAQYSVEGVSASGLRVRMVGTLQGVLAGTGGNFSSRIMIGTWIEDGGRTGDINGYASPIAVDANAPATGL